MSAKQFGLVIILGIVLSINGYFVGYVSGLKDCKREMEKNVKKEKLNGKSNDINVSRIKHFTKVPQ